ncbi:MAG TPA: ABC transporter permease [Rugosimonospora sp.]|jgi:peptide/nickel transport system permease protein
MRWRYFAGRAAATLFVAAGILVVTFVLTHVIPADPARVAAGARATPEQVARVRVELGLNRPLPAQFVTFIDNLLHGDFGTSFVTNRPVSQDLQIFFPATLELVLCATVVMTLLGVAAGVYLAHRPSFIGNLLVRGGGLLGIAAPVFLTALLAQIVFFGKLGWLPSGGRIDGAPPPTITGLYLVDATLTGDWSALANSAWHLVLPVLVLALSRAGVIMRFVAGEMHAALDSEYAQTARAKGAGRARLAVRHALRNAAIPVVSMVGLQFGWLLGGTVLVESVFSWPGLGAYVVNSIVSLDFMPVIATAVVLGLTFAIVNLLVDLAQELLDPRIAA